MMPSVAPLTPTPPTCCIYQCIICLAFTAPSLSPSPLVPLHIAVFKSLLLLLHHSVSVISRFAHLCWPALQTHDLLIPVSLHQLVKLYHARFRPLLRTTPWRIQLLPVYSTALWQPFLFYLSPQTSNIFTIFSTLCLLSHFRNHSFIAFNLNTGHSYTTLHGLLLVGLELHVLFSSLFPPSCSLLLIV